MGFNATVVVLLDRLHEIENDPEFGRKLCAAIRFRGSYPDGHERDRFGAECTGQTQVIEVHHADSYFVTAVGGNCGRVLGYGGGYANDEDAIVKELVAFRKRGKKR
jgi:hypothetical protein